MCYLNVLLRKTFLIFFCGLTLSWRRSPSYRNHSTGFYMIGTSSIGFYMIGTSSIGFYMIGTYVMKELTQSAWIHLRCILRHFIQRLRDISKRVDLQISETSRARLIKDVSSETSLRSLRISQRNLWVASQTVILGFQTKGFFGYLFIYRRVFEYFAKLT